MAPLDRPSHATEGLLERETELAALDGVLGDARAGDGRVVLIEGRAGIGKTQPAGRGAAAGRRAGLQVLSARGGELEREFAFGVVRQLFEPRARDPDARERCWPAPPHRPRRVFESPAEGAGDDSSFAVLHGLYWLTVNLSAEQPLLLAIDDLHWCDRALAALPRLPRPPARGAARLLAREPAHQRAGRRRRRCSPSSRRPAHVRAASRGRSARTRRDELVRERLGDEPTSASRHACHAATGGNPLLLNELLKALERRRRASPTPRTRATCARARPARRVARRARRGSPACRGRRSRSRARSPCSATAPTSPPSRRWPRSTSARPPTATRRARPRRDPAARPPLGFVHPLVARRRLPRHPARRARAAARARRAAARRGRRAREQVAAHLLAIAAARRGRGSSPTLRAAAARAALHKGAPESARRLPDARARGAAADRAASSCCSSSGMAEALDARPGRDGAPQPAYERSRPIRARDRGRSTSSGRCCSPARPEESAAVARAAAAELPERVRRPARAPRGGRARHGLFGTGDWRAHPSDPASHDAAGTRRRRRCSRRSPPSTGRTAAAGRASAPRLRARRARGRRPDRRRQRRLLHHGPIITSSSLADRERGGRSLAGRVARRAPPRLALRDRALDLWYGYTLPAGAASWPRPRRCCEAASRASSAGATCAARDASTCRLSSRSRCSSRATRPRRAGCSTRRRAPDRAADGARYWLDSAGSSCCSPRAAPRRRRGRQIGRALRARLPVRGATPTSTRGARSRREAHDRLGARERGARAGCARRSSWRAAGARRATIGRALRMLGTLERDDGLDHLQEAVERARRLAGAARAGEGARRARLGAAALAQADRGARAAAPRARAGRRAAAPRARRGQSAPSSTPTGARPRRAASGVGSLTASERRVADLAADGPDEPRHRADALRHAEDRRGAPRQRLPQARHQLAARAAPGARGRGLGARRANTGVDGWGSPRCAGAVPILAQWTTRSSTVTLELRLAATPLRPGHRRRRTSSSTAGSAPARRRARPTRAREGLMSTIDSRVSLGTLRRTWRRPRDRPRRGGLGPRVAGLNTTIDQRPR